MKIAIDYLLVFSHFWFATPQLVLQADWQEVWHSPQPPFLALSHRLRVSRVLILSIICISDLLNSNGFPGRPPEDSHLKTGKILAYHPYKVKIFQQFGYWGSSVYGGNLRGFPTRDSITRRHSPFHCFSFLFVGHGVGQPELYAEKSRSAPDGELQQRQREDRHCIGADPTGKTSH